MNVLNQVEKLLDDRENNPKWAEDILFELREIKTLLKNLQPRTAKNREKEKHAYFAFVNRLRKELRADILNDIYPEIHYDNRELGINFKGHIYDKATTEELPAPEAFAVYRFLYENRDRLDRYISKESR